MRNSLLIALLALLPMLAEADLLTFSRTDFPSGRPPERLMAPSSTDADTYEEILQTGNALHTYNAYRAADERIEDSTTGTGYSSVSPECKSSGPINLASGSVTVYPGPATICGVYVSTTIGTAASTIDDNTTATITLPVSLPVGSYNMFGAQIRTSLKVTRGASGTGTINILYRPLATDTTW